MQQISKTSKSCFGDLLTIWWSS